MAANQLGNLNNKQVQRKPYFVGFSTIDQPAPPYTLYDINLIKRDLLNQFQTPIGERIMLPSYGTNIYNYLFDPFDDLTKNAIIEDAIRVIASESRVQLQNIEVFQQDKTLNLMIILIFQPNAITESLYVSFSTADQESF